MKANNQDLQGEVKFLHNISQEQNNRGNAFQAELDQQNSPEAVSLPEFKIYSIKSKIDIYRTLHI